MLSKTEKRFVKSPVSFMPRKRTYTKRQLEKKITKTANDIGLLIDSKYDISEITDSIISHSNIQVKQVMRQILKAKEILDTLGAEPEIFDSEKVSSSKKIDDTINEEDWDV